MTKVEFKQNLGSSLAYKASHQNLQKLSMGGKKLTSCDPGNLCHPMATGLAHVYFVMVV